MIIVKYDEMNNCNIRVKDLNEFHVQQRGPAASMLIDVGSFWRFCRFPERLPVSVSVALFQIFSELPFNGNIFILSPKPLKL
jgi:hypothetical protein